MKGEIRKNGGILMRSHPTPIDGDRRKGKVEEEVAKKRWREEEEEKEDIYTVGVRRCWAIKATMRWPSGPQAEVGVKKKARRRRRRGRRRKEVEVEKEPIRGFIVNHYRDRGKRKRMENKKER